MRDIKATHFSDVGKDVELEPFLFTLIGEEQTMRKTTKMNDEVRVSASASEWEESILQRKGF